MGAGPYAADGSAVAETSPVGRCRARRTFLPHLYVGTVVPLFNLAMKNEAPMNTSRWRNGPHANGALSGVPSSPAAVGSSVHTCVTCCSGHFVLPIDGRQFSPQYTGTGTSARGRLNGSETGSTRGGANYVQRSHLSSVTLWQRSTPRSNGTKVRSDEPILK